jgi:hypothetical protein
MRLKVGMLGRLQGFLRAHPLGDEPGDKVIARFTEKLDRVRALLLQQHEGEVNRQAENAKRRALQRQISQMPLRHLAGIASSLEPQHREVAATLGQSVHSLGTQKFRTTAQSIAATLQAHHDLLRSNGMAEGTLQDLTELLVEYEQAVSDADAARRAHTGARAELATLGRELMQMAHQLDRMVMYQFHDRPEVVGAWKSARNVAWPAGEVVKGTPVLSTGTAVVVSQEAQPS